MLILPVSNLDKATLLKVIGEIAESLQRLASQQNLPDSQHWNLLRLSELLLDAIDFAEGLSSELPRQAADLALVYESVLASCRCCLEAGYYQDEGLAKLLKTLQSRLEKNYSAEHRLSAQCRGMWSEFVDHHSRGVGKVLAVPPLLPKRAFHLLIDILEGYQNACSQDVARYESLINRSTPHRICRLLMRYGYR